MKIEIEMTNKLFKDVDYYLGLRYGKRKSIETKIKNAIVETIALAANEEIERLRKEF